MNWQPVLYLTPFLASAVISLAVAVYSWRYRNAQGAVALAWIMLLIAIWSLILILMLSGTPQTFFFWRNLTYLPVSAIPVVFLLFMFSYLGKEEWLRPVRLILLFSVPLFVQFSIWTDPIFGLFTPGSDPPPIVRDSLLLPAPTAWGIGLIIHTIYSYLLLLANAILILIAIRRAAPPYRRQSIMMLLALIPAWAANIYVALDNNPWRLMAQPMGMALSGLVFAFAIFRYRLLDLVPIARDTLVDGISDGVIVFDTGQRIVDINPAALKLIGQTKDQTIGQSAKQLSNPWRDLMTQLSIAGSPIDIVVPQGEVTRYYSPRISPLIDRRGNTRGHLYILHDVTERKQAEEIVKHLNEILEERVNERTENLHRRTEELEALARVSSALRQAKTSDDMIAGLIKEIVQVVQADEVGIFLLEENDLVLRGLRGRSSALVGKHHPPSDDPLWQTVKTEVLQLFDLTQPTNFALSEWCQALVRGMATMIVVPLQTSEKTLGVLHISFVRPIHTFEEYRHSLATIAELGALGLQRIATMEMLERLVQDRTRDLATLFEITALTTESADLQMTLERGLERTLDAMKSRSGLLHLVDDDGKTLRLVAKQGFSTESNSSLNVQLRDGSFWKRLLDSNSTMIIPNTLVELEPPFASDLQSTPALLGVPIQVKGRVWGTLCVFGETIQRFSAEDIALLAAIAAHLGVAVESARLRRRAEQAAVVEERQRLARDLHDSVSQALYGLTLFVEAGKDSTRAGNLSQVEYYLNRSGDTARQALREMRLLIYELRPKLLEEEGLLGAVRRRLESVERRAGMETELIVPNPIELPAEVERDLYQIIQEALNNVLKHSAATHVTLRMVSESARLELEIMDNGKGFDPKTIQEKAGIGLASMRERAQRSGGTLSIRSQPGQGTCIQVMVLRIDDAKQEILE